MRHIQLAEHFTIPKILLFSLPSIGMQIVDNTYQIADGYFISNYISEAAFEAENLIFPPLVIVMYVGLMFGTGASAIISKMLGEGRKEQANQLFTRAIAVLTVLGVLLSALLYFMLPTVTVWVHASEELRPDCIVYGQILALFMPFQMLSLAFHPLLITAERPGLGLITTLSNAAANILMDWLFVAVFGWGMRGAALATGLAWMVSAVIPFVYFAGKKSSLRFVRPGRCFESMGKVLYNGASEMVDAVSYAIVSVIFNLQLIRYLGDAGIGAYAVSEYMGGLFLAVFYGISMSIVPVVGYHLGDKNVRELNSLLRNGLIVMSLLGVVMTGLCFALAEPISLIFVGKHTKELISLSIEALKLVSLSYLLSGITTYCSSYFTGLNQGTASLVISLVKGVAGPLAMVYLLPGILPSPSTGIWLSPTGAEILTLLTAMICFLWWKRKTAGGYLPEPPDPDSL
ncbi:MAG: polysaccharide biosynthesis C-terminal domain-containing protein [Clostridia bacterium]|nr:polysaccharide biosynthesis C-terminal domain-containing protein [Clostridia bacterium]